MPTTLFFCLFPSVCIQEGIVHVSVLKTHHSNVLHIIIWHYVDTIKTFELVNYDIIFRKLGARELPGSLLHPLLQLVQGEKDASVLHSLVHLVEWDILS